MFTNSLPKTILRLLAVLALLIFGLWSFRSYQNAQEKLDSLDPQVRSAAAQKERQELLAAAGKLMVLPAGEPLIFDIENAEAMAQSQPFFANVQEGDKVLIYVQAGKSIIYSPARNIIVNVGTLSVSGASLPLDTENPLQVEIRGGGASQERLAALEEQLADLVEITAITAAANDDYQGPTIVALTTDEERLQQAQFFASSLGIRLADQLPAGEASSSAEVVLIVGN